MIEVVLSLLLATALVYAAYSFLFSLFGSLIRLFWPRPGDSLKLRLGDVVKYGLCSCMLLGVFVALLWPAPCRVPEAGRRAGCTNNLSQIAKALSNYEAKHGRFPPAYSVDKDGRPLHSWRVLLLPYLEEEELYKQLRRDEPWDSPHNKAVFDAAPMPKVFSCPTERRERGEEGEKETSYVMIVGPGTISDGANSARLEDIKDGASNTIAVAEMSGSGIHWAEPRDLKGDEMSYRINDPDQPRIRSRHGGMANAAFCDGSVKFLAESIPPELIKALTTIAGGEDVWEFFENY
jgi:prepilin-type processing-associated H-X9-DG protein